MKILFNEVKLYVSVFVDVKVTVQDHGCLNIKCMKIEKNFKLHHSNQGCPVSNFSHSELSNHSALFRVIFFSKCDYKAFASHLR